MLMLMCVICGSLIIMIGIGIAPAMITTLFTPYSQASHSISRQHGGSGLGLSIVKRLVELMGGHISVASTEGKGTTMTIDLPFGKWLEPLEHVWIRLITLTHPFLHALID
jgi:signal transduction histidine kinase